jgi:hypothetical protein
MRKDIAVVVLSCDKYSELWDSFSSTFIAHWPDCPYDRYLVTNFLEYNSAYFKTLKVGEDISWSSNILLALSGLKATYKYVLVTLDDLFLAKKVDTITLSLIINSFLEIDGNYISLINNPKFTKKYNQYFGEIEAGALYRPTCVLALWKLSVLEDMVIPSENAWEFERNGSVRSKKYNKFFSVYKSVFIYKNVVVRGKILRKEAIYFNLLHCNSLSIMSVKENIAFYLRYIVFKTIISVIPWKLQKRMRMVKDDIIKR